MHSAIGKVYEVTDLLDGTSGLQVSCHMISLSELNWQSIQAEGNHPEARRKRCSVSLLRCRISFVYRARYREGYERIHPPDPTYHDLLVERKAVSHINVLALHLLTKSLGVINAHHCRSHD